MHVLRKFQLNFVYLVHTSKVKVYREKEKDNIYNPIGFRPTPKVFKLSQFGYQNHFQNSSSQTLNKFYVVDYCPGQTRLKSQPKHKNQNKTQMICAIN